MKRGSTVSLRIVTGAAWIAIAASVGHAQLPTARKSPQAAPPVPTVARPAEGQVVTGDLAITVQVAPGVRASKFSIEASYWNAARNAWAYPGLLCPDFAGGPTATTTVAEAVRVKFAPAATRWRIRVLSVDPPGGWGPWREFTWQPAADTPRIGETPQPPARAAGTAGTPASSSPAGAAQVAAAPTTGQATAMVAGTPPPTPPSQPSARPAPQTGTGTVAPGAPSSTTALPPSPIRPATGAGTATTPPSTPPPAPPPQPPARQAPETAPARIPTAPPPSAPMPVTPPPAPKPLVVPPPAAPPAPPSSGGALAKAAGSSSAVKSSPSIGAISRTSLQVWDGRATVDNIKYFVSGPVNVDWAKKDFKWWFQYTTSAKGLPGNARWEISRTPFVEWAEWKPTDGYGYAGVADTTMFLIDLKPYAPIPGSLATTATVPGPPKTLVQSQPKPANASPVPDIPGQSTPPPSGASSKPGTSSTQVMAGAKQPPPAAAGAALAAGPSPVKLPPLQSLYVRVVPLDASGKDADLPSNAVELKFGPAEKAPPFALDPEMWPQVTFLPDEYRPVQAYTSDWQCWVKATQSMHFLGGDIKKGELSNSCHHDSDPVSDFMDAVGGFIGLLKEFVNGVSSAFNTLKGIATSAIVSALGCSKDATCQALISAGINGGMVALGMPPSLPDFDALQAMGEDYLAETIAQQVASQTGIPFADEATKAAVKDLIDKGKQAAESGGGGSSMFWIPDDGHQYKPLLVMLSVSNPGTKNTAAMYLEVAETSTRYKTATLPIPRLQPNQSLKIAVALQATNDPKAWMALLPTADDVAALDVATVVKKQQQADAALNAWRTEYLSGTVTFRAKLMLSPFDKQVFERSCLAAKAWCVVK